MAATDRRMNVLRLATAFLSALLAACTGAPPNSTSAPTAVSATPAAPTQPPASPFRSEPAPGGALSGRILFVRGPAHGDETAFSIGADGTGERQLTESGRYVFQRLSPDRTLLLLVPTDDAEQPEGKPLTGGVQPLDGGPFTWLPLTDQTLNLIPLCWSPDGRRLAFEGWDDTDPSRTGVYTARFDDGGGLRRLSTNSGDLHDIPVDWSPDGKQLVFFRSDRAEPWDLGSLWVVNADGTGLHELEMGRLRPGWSARWSPDGTRILFASGRLVEPGAIWTIRPDGSGLTKVWEEFRPRVSDRAGVVPGRRQDRVRTRSGGRRVPPSREHCRRHRRGRREPRRPP